MYRLVLVLILVLLLIPLVAWAAGDVGAAGPMTAYGALALLGFGLFQKHVIRRLPNNAIPWINLAVGTAVGYATTGSVQGAITFGGTTAAVATGAHQYVKGALRQTPIRGI